MPELSASASARIPNLLDLYIRGSSFEDLKQARQAFIQYTVARGLSYSIMELKNAFSHHTTEPLLDRAYFDNNEIVKMGDLYSGCRNHDQSKFGLKNLLTHKS